MFSIFTYVAHTVSLGYLWPYKSRKVTKIIVLEMTVI